METGSPRWSFEDRGIVLKLIGTDEGSGVVRVRVDSLDDLWFLDKILSVGTVVGMETQRRLDPVPDKLRPDRTERVTVFLRLSVEGADFQEFSNMLRVRGTIVEGPPGMEGYHTLTIGPGSVLEIGPPRLSGADLSLIKEAERSSSLPKTLAVYVDDRTEQLFRVHDYGIEELGASKGVSSGKMFDVADLSVRSRFSEITEMIGNHLQEGTTVVLLGPVFFKEKLATYLKETLGLRPQQVLIAPSSSSGKNAVVEFLSGSKGIRGLIGEMRMAHELELLDELFERISKGGLAAYGREEVLKALQAGAADHLLLSESNFKKERGDSLFELCQKTGAFFSIISSRHDKGRMFAHMGGIAAFLRYRLDH